MLLLTSLLCGYFLQICSIHLGNNLFLFPTATVPPSQNTFEEVVLCFKCAFKKKIDWFVPFEDQTSRSVDATAGSFKIEDALIKNVCVDVQKKGLKKHSFPIHLLERLNSYFLWK